MTNYDTGEVEGTGIEPRTRRACVEPLAIDAWAYGKGSGLFDVYSGSNGEPYVVDLRERTCTCPDAEQRGAKCKHQRRVKLALGLLDVPAELRDEIDGTLAANRRKFGAEPEPEPDVEPVTVDDTKPERAVATDGGQALGTEPQGSSDEDGRPEDCDCGEWNAGLELPCWPCYRDGFDEPAEGSE